VCNLMAESVCRNRIAHHVAQGRLFTGEAASLGDLVRAMASGWDAHIETAVDSVATRFAQRHAELVAANKVKENLHDELERARAAADVLNQVNAALRKHPVEEVTRLRGELATADKVRQDLRDELERARAATDVLNQVNAALRKQAADYEAAVKGELERSNRALEEENQKLRAQIAAAHEAAPAESPLCAAMVLPKPIAASPERATAASIRTLQEPLILAPGGVLDRALEAIRAQALAGKPYARIDLRKLDFIPANETTFLFRALKDALVNLGYSKVGIACALTKASYMHAWGCAACLMPGDSGKCSTPESCAHGLLAVYWDK